MIGSPGVIGAASKVRKSWTAPTPQASAWAAAVERAKATNVVDMAMQRVELRRASGQELQGPCPKCGGTDRLHVKAQGWFCRQCKPFDAGHGWNDAIDWVQHMDGKTFDEAVTVLTGIRRDSTQATRAPSTPLAKVAPMPKRPELQTDEWRARVQPILDAAIMALLDGDNAGAAYLHERGLTPATWAEFGLGFGAWRKFEDDKSYADHPSILIPWYRGGKLQAVRYRLLSPIPHPLKADGSQHDPQKAASIKDSNFSGMYGGQTLCWCMEQKRTLVICEGEINAMSIWQAARDSYLDVLSTGSESAIIPKSALDYAAKFRTCIVWMDKADIARKWADMIPGAIAIASPNGMDANDMLRAGKLTYFLAHVRTKAATTDEKQLALKWDLWDQQHLGDGVDDKTAELIEGMV